MNVKVHYEKTTYRTMELEVDEDDLLAYINKQTEYADGVEYESLDQVQKNEREDFEYLLREFLEEAGQFEHGEPTHIPSEQAGEDDVEIQIAEIL